MCLLLYQFHQRGALNAGGIPCQRQRAPWEQQALPGRKCFAQQLGNLAKMLDAIGQVTGYGMHARAAGDLLHMQTGLVGLAMCQDEQARRPFSPDLELVAPPRPPALVQLLVGNALAVEVLLDEDGCSLNILPYMLYAEGVIT